MSEPTRKEKMTEINYNDPDLEEAALALAEATPRQLDQPTTPPIHWRLEGDILRVLLADGRTVRAPFAQYQMKGKPQPSQIMGLPARAQALGIRKPVIPSLEPPANLKPDRKKKAVHKSDESN
jgi:hypothetical protein